MAEFPLDARTGALLPTSALPASARPRGASAGTSTPARPHPRAGVDPQTPAATSELALFAAAGSSSPQRSERAGAPETPGPSTGAAPDRAAAPVRVRARTPAGASESDSPPAGSRGLRGKDFRDAMRRAQTGRKTTRAVGKRPVAPTPEPVVGGAELTATAHCIRCEWTAGPGDPGEIDKAAEKHVRVGHPTSTVAEVTP